MCGLGPLIIDSNLPSISLRLGQEIKHVIIGISVKNNRNEISYPRKAAIERYTFTQMVVEVNGILDLQSGALFAGIGQKPYCL